MDIAFKKLIPEAITPATDKDGLILDLYAAEDVFISPNEIAAVSTGICFIFPDELGLMICPPGGLNKNTSLRYAKGIMVLQNNNYSQDAVKILLQNSCVVKESPEKVHEYTFIDGTIVSDSGTLYDRGTIKICRGNCIARMMPVDAFYPNTEDIPDKFVKK